MKSDEARPEILVVESLALFREVEAYYLSRVANVRTAGNAAAALNAIEKQRPQLIVTSIDLPDRPGEELVRELRRAERTRDIPIVALTRGCAEEHARAVRAGATDVLTRPLAHETLVQAVERFLGAPLLASGLPRAHLARPIRLSDPEHEATGTMRNVSRGGCYVESPEWLPSEGDEVALGFGLPGFERQLALTARLVWRRVVPGRHQPGAGFRFLALDGRTSRALHHFVATCRAYG